MRHAEEELKIMAIDKPGLILSTDTLELVPVPQRIRAVFAGRLVADTRRATLLREKRHLPVFYLPAGDVTQDALEASDTRTHCPRKGDARNWNLRVNGRLVENAVWAYPTPLPGVKPLADYLGFDFHAIDTWYEEDDPLDTHPRDPYHRIDTLTSARHVHVEVAGEVIADSRRPVMLVETGLPPRYYLPVFDTAWASLRGSKKRTSCPYKGHSRYFNVEVGGELREDVAWSYPFPRAAAVNIADRLAFDPARCDVFTVDGEKMSS